MKLNKDLKMIIGIFLSPFMWMIFLTIYLQMNRFPEIWTPNRIVIFWLTAIPLSILIYFIQRRFLFVIVSQAEEEKKR